MSFLRFLGRYGRRLFQGLEVSRHLSSASCWWSHLSFLSLGGGLPYKISREASLRASGYISTEGDESPQKDKAACSSTVWVLAGGYSCCTTTWRKNLTEKLKIYGPKINRSRKAVVGLARKTRSRHWFVTVVLL